MKTLSVLIAHRNDLDLLKTTLSSLSEAGLNEKNCEIIIQDNFEFHDKIIYELKPKFKKVYVEKDNGIYSALNRAIDRANSEWTLILGAGDTLLNKEIIQHLPRIQKNYSVVYGKTIFRRKGFSFFVDDIGPNLNWRKGMYFCHQSAFVRTQKLKNYKFETRYRISADYNFFVKNFLEHQYLFIDQVISEYLLNGFSFNNAEQSMIEREKIKYDIGKINKPIYLFNKLVIKIWFQLKKVWI